jgi:Wax ester synthase/diacylglycerol acyltransferase catalytic domain/WS/DGAT C-terminal domain
MDVVPGLPEGRARAAGRVHHVVADGLRGVAMMSGLFDPTAEPANDAASSAPPWQPRPLPTGPELLADNLRHRAAAAHNVVRRLLELPARLHALRALTAEARTRSASVSTLAGPVGSRRRMTVVRLPLAALRRAAHDRHVTINDLLLAAVTRGLRDMLNGQDACRPDLILRASVPLGARDGSAAGMLVASLPVGIEDSEERLHLICEQTRRRKQHPGEGIAAILAMPPSMARLGVLWGRHTASSHINLYVTNVPGPPQPLYLRRRGRGRRTARAARGRRPAQRHRSLIQQRARRLVAGRPRRSRPSRHGSRPSPRVRRLPARLVSFLRELGQHDRDGDPGGADGADGSPGPDSELFSPGEAIGSEQAPSCTRRPLQQQAQLAADPRLGACLEQPAGRQHHRDHRAGEASSSPQDSANSSRDPHPFEDVTRPASQRPRQCTRAESHRADDCPLPSAPPLSTIGSALMRYTQRRSPYRSNRPAVLNAVPP